jgi:leader peptidase (prepilin peptidase)/N-methyltransferase
VVYLFYALLFCLGLAAGSFLNVLAFRYRPDRNVFNWKNLAGRSHCPYCKKTLSASELIPLLSFLIQKGRCRHCRQRLSFQYPFIEGICGLIFVLVPLHLNNFYNISNTAFAALRAPRFYYGLVLIWLAAFFIWLLIAVIDSRRYIIPDELNGFLIILALVLMVVLSVNSDKIEPLRESFLRHYSILFSLSQNLILNHLLSAALGGLFFGAFSLLTKGRAMGFGDAKLAFSSGLLLGWPDIGLVMVLAFILGGAWGTWLLLKRQKTMRDKLPFAPFFILGIAVTFFFGFSLIKNYFALLSL